MAFSEHLSWILLSTNKIQKISQLSEVHYCFKTVRWNKIFSFGISLWDRLHEYFLYFLFTTRCILRCKLKPTQKERVLLWAFKNKNIVILLWKEMRPQSHNVTHVKNLDFALTQEPAPKFPKAHQMAPSCMSLGQSCESWANSYLLWPKQD